jgi:hypothetical protein
MKGLFIHTIIIFGFLLNHHLLISDGINSIYSINGIRVMAVGNSGNIIKSFDSGLNWFAAPIGNTNYYSVSGNILSIYIVGDSGIVLSSSNQGNTFNQSTVANGTNLRSVCILNSLKGWIAGYNGLILKTTNGGLNWIQQSTSTSRNLSSIKFKDSLNGVACGEAGTILATTNGGAN